MTLTEILIAQLTDPFRLGLVVALVATMLRTQQVTGRVLPLIAGLIFVAAIIPLTITRDLAPFWTQFGVGLLATLGHLAVVLAIRHVVLRWLA